ncbi:unnamed protein product [Durusdinium trenchii]|uniref:ATP synthase subunit b n=1 Tax=Durusdinium trenchii TaxID=1381693 RepID=A0ABP0HI37_9DINO
MGRRSPLAYFGLGLMALLCGSAFVMPAVPKAAPEKTQLLTAGAGLMLATLPAPAYAGGMFDFGLTLPFVALSFLTMMFVLNALWYSPMTEEVDERNAKLLQTLSEATDMLAKADEMQVQYTADIKEAREKASKELADARKATEEAIATEARAADSKREAEARDFKAKLDAEFAEKVKGSESTIKERQQDFVKSSLAAVGL